MSEFHAVPSMDLRIAARSHFDLNPLTGAQMRKYGQSKRRQMERKEHKKLLKRAYSDAAINRIVHEWNHSRGELTESQAVSLAILGVPWYAFLIRLFLTELAKWAFRRISNS